MLPLYPKGWAKQDIRTPWFTIYPDDDGVTWKRSATHMVSAFLSVIPENQMREVLRKPLSCPSGDTCSAMRGLNWRSTAARRFLAFA